TFPDVLFEPLKQLGQAAFPIAMITLGAYLSKYKAHDLDREMMKNVSAVCAAKLLILPALLLVLLKYLPIGMDYKFFLFLQGVMPTAVSLVVIGSYTGADNKFLSGTIFYSHLAGVISIPLWFSLFRIVMSG
ncbi:MAG: AEC family transporter, partial [Candidatus Omnitrophica bacterium]|nr:AEC family transporter [Candidatus Omnitrophota bacterium]